RGPTPPVFPPSGGPPNNFFPAPPGPTGTTRGGKKEKKKTREKPRKEGKKRKKKNVSVQKVGACGRGRAACVVGGGLPPGGGAAGHSDSGVPLVKLTPVRPARKTLARHTEQPGQIEAFEETPLFAKVTGYVTKVPVDIGDLIAGPRLSSDGKTLQAGQLLV